MDNHYSVADIAELYPEKTPTYIGSLLSTWKDYLKPFKVKGKRGLFFDEEALETFKHLYYNRPSITRETKTADKAFNYPILTNTNGYLHYNSLVTTLDDIEKVNRGALLGELRNYIEYYKYGKQLYIKADQRQRLLNLAEYFIIDSLEIEDLPNIWIKYEIRKQNDGTLVLITKECLTCDEVTSQITKEELIKKITK